MMPFVSFGDSVGARERRKLAAEKKASDKAVADWRRKSQNSDSAKFKLGDRRVPMWFTVAKPCYMPYR